MNNNIIAIISARLNSRRLPGKALINYNGKNTLDRIIENLKNSRYIDKIIVATSDRKSDDKISYYCKKKGYKFSRGSKLNLFERFIAASKKYNPKTIVRVTGDNPLISFEITDFMIKKHLKKKADFTFMNKEKLPIGVCPEVINFFSIKKILTYKLNFNYSEYMTYYFKNNPKIFNLNCLNPPKKFKLNNRKFRLTLDYKKDLIFHKKLENYISNLEKPITLLKIYNILKKKPSLSKLNSGIDQINNKNILKKKIFNASKIKS